MKLKVWISALIVGSLAGCTLPVTGQGQGHGASLSVQPAVQAGSYHAQAVVSPYTPESIHHLQVRLFTLSGSTETPVTDGTGSPLVKDVASASLEATVTFSNLPLNTTYRVRAFAYGDSTTASLISTPDAGSYVDVHVSGDKSPTLATLPVKLIDRVFSGAATASGIVAASGSVSHTGTESISFN